MGDVIQLFKRKPGLIVNHTTGKVTGNQETNPEFGDRVERIKASLDKINRLIADLKAMSKEQGEP